MENTEGKALKEKLFNSKKSGWENLSDDELAAIFKYADEYMYYLNSSKTEKEIVQTSKEILLKSLNIFNLLLTIIISLLLNSNNLSILYSYKTL